MAAVTNRELPSPIRQQLRARGFRSTRRGEDAPGVVRLSVLTPRSAPTDEPADLERDHASEEEWDIPEQVPERRNINQTDAQVWAELRDRHQWLGNLTEWFESWRYNCAPPSSRRYANRRDYSSLESI